MSKKKRIIDLIFGYRKQKTAQCPICKRVYDLNTEHDIYKARKCLTVCTSLNIGEMPQFVRFKHDKNADTVFRLNKVIKDEGTFYEDAEDAYLEYWVDNGAWGVEPYMKNGKMYSKHQYDHLNDKELVEATKEQYIKATGEYGLKSIIDPNYEPPDEIFTVDDIPF